jgi:aspartate-semialdehyde dehydrogenase
MGTDPATSASTSSPGLSVALVGATGAAGSDILDALSRASLGVREWRLFASPVSQGTEVEVAGKFHKVSAIVQGAGRLRAFEGVDIAILCAPPGVNRDLGMALAEEGIAVVDLGAGNLGRAPLVVPLAGLGDWSAFEEARLCCAPSPGAALLACLLAPLTHLGLSEVRGSLLLSAGVFGKSGAEELSRQVVAVFNQAEPPRRVFPSGLAFDLNAQVGELKEGWTTEERRVHLELAAAMGSTAPLLAVQLIQVPLFAGMSASLQLNFSGEVDAAAVARALSALPTVQLADPVPGPRRLVGTTAIRVGRLRDDPSGRGVSLFASVDNLRFGASAQVLSILLHLRREGLL